MLRFGKKVDSCREVWVDNGGNLMIINSEYLQGLFIQILLSVPVSSETRILFLWYKEGISRVKVLWPVFSNAKVTSYNRLECPELAINNNTKKGPLILERFYLDQWTLLLKDYTHTFKITHKSSNVLYQ
jgi:hypothetical protein